MLLTATPIGAAIAGAATTAAGGDPRPAFLSAGVLTAVTIGLGWLAALRHYDMSLTIAEGQLPDSTSGGTYR
jgi:hypothetical protein